MPDPTAAERAREVIAERFRDCGGVWTPETSKRARDTLARWALDALLADPSLLAALAVEAGGMEHIGAVRASKRSFVPMPYAVVDLRPLRRLLAERLYGSVVNEEADDG